VAAPGKAWFSGCSRTEIVGSNTAGVMDVFLVTVVCCLMEASETRESLV
jgi:hypothetical protein